MATQTMYASGPICDIVCKDCEQKPCPHQNWITKNSCAKIIEYNEQLGKCCATCMHCIDELYCSEKVDRKKRNGNTDYSQFLIGENIFEHTCDKWTNTWEEEE